MEIIQRIQKSKKCLLEKTYIDNFDWKSIPLTSSLQVCSECHTTPSAWYITAIKQNGLNGLTNGVMPGFKCNMCKESFLRKYLQPNWIIDSPSALIGGVKTWQPYGVVSLSHPFVQELVSKNQGQ